MADHVPDPRQNKTSDLAVFGFCELLGLVFGLPPGEDLYHGAPITIRMVVFLAIGGIFAVIGPAWPFIKNKIQWRESMTFATSFARTASDFRYWLVALLVLFVYMFGPDVYQRATAPSLEKETSAHTQTPEDILKLIASLRVQLNSATDTVESQRRELDVARRDLEIARHPVPRSGPLSTASRSLAMGKGQPREIAADNVRWITWDARARGSELRWTAPTQQLYSLSLTQASYPDLSVFKNGEYSFIKEGTTYRIFDIGYMSIVFLTFDKPVDTGSFQLSSESTLPKWKYWCKDNSVCALWFDERPDNLSFTVRIGR
jgi:hypothetical protein